MADTNAIKRIKAHADSLESVPHNKQFRADLYALIESATATPPADAALADELCEAAHQYTCSERHESLFLRAAAALRARAVPDGFVLVPKEPTEHMVDVGCTVVDGKTTYYETACIYRAMLVASKEAK